MFNVIQSTYDNLLGVGWEKKTVTQILNTVQQESISNSVRMCTKYI